MFLRLSITCITLSTPLWADIVVPSGQTVTLHDMRIEETIARFRYIAPDIARETGHLNYADVEADFQALCSEHALHLLTKKGITPTQIVVSLSDRPVEFGITAPEATQFFEAFRIENESCVWDIF